MTAGNFVPHIPSPEQLQDSTYQLVEQIVKALRECKPRELNGTFQYSICYYKVLTTAQKEHLKKLFTDAGWLDVEILNAGDRPVPSSAGVVRLRCKSNTTQEVANVA